MPQQRPDRVKQVWFEGRHTDVGGGLDDSRLSDRSLRWMVREAQAEGLEFDLDRLEELIARGSTATGPVRAHDSMSLGWWLLNLAARVRYPRSHRFYGDSWRRLEAPQDQRVFLASCAQPSPTYNPPNLKRWTRDATTACPWSRPGTR